ncbi:MAG: hypothetical protein J6W22_04295 [Fibrobacter sp.]|nr:hypothetical protein [Fibrobacter sp.]
MKKLFVLAASILFAACGDDNSSAPNTDTLTSSEEVTSSSSSEETTLNSSAEDVDPSSPKTQYTKNSSSKNQEVNSSSTSINSSESKTASSSSKKNATNSSVNTDFGEGYTYAIAHRYDEATGIMYQRIETCNYHPSTRTFAWEENAIPLDSNRLTVIGDSMWIGPVEKFVADDPNMQQSYDAYENRETLLLSTDHNGIYGKWTMTGCIRTYGETEFKCTSSIAHMRGIARTLTITTDSVYNTTVVDLSSITGEINKLKLSQTLHNNLGFDIGDLYIDTLVETQVIKVISDTAFSIGSQTFTKGGSAKFDDTGMNFYETFSSNGKTCTKHEQLGLITKEQCLEGNADFLLSDRGDEKDSYHYEEGPVEGFSLDNRDEYYECTQSLVTEETKNILSPHARN